MTPEIEALPFDQLRTLNREIAALIADRRHKELDDIRERVALLGFTPDDLAPPKAKRGTGSAKYANPDDPTETYGGKGRKPAWLTEKIEAGHQLEEFRV
jgi:DNA-binding protein H-NS